MTTLRLARFFTEVRLRTRTMIPPEIDPVGLIMARVGIFPNTPASKALRKATIVIIATDGDMATAGESFYSRSDFGCCERCEHPPSDTAWWNAQLLPPCRCVMGPFVKLDIDGRPRFAKHPIDESMKVKIAAIDPDCA